MRLLFAVSIAAALAAAAGAHAHPLVASAYSDHMVIQRGQPVVVRGSARPGEQVSVTFAGATGAAAADDAGKWRVEFPSMSAGGPYDIRVSAASGAAQTVSDVLIGDVWLCSGQSNMAYPVSSALNAAYEISNAVDDTIRLLTIGRASSPAPLADADNVGKWAVASPETVGDFSAACFFFARELRKSHDVPLGLINAAWGGAQIEAWLSNKGLRAVPGFDNALDILVAYRDDPERAMALFGESWEEWWRINAEGGVEPWSPEANDDGWPDAPMRDWKTYGDPALENHDGMVWFRTSFDLSADNDGAPGVLSLGGLDEVDAVWVNGAFVGASFGWGDRRAYRIPEGVVKAGDNVVAMNVFSSWAAGGMTGPEEDVALDLDNGKRVPLPRWRYQKAPAGLGGPPLPPWGSVVGLTGLYNAMIAPLEGLGLAGAFWYQGETNAGRAGQYEALLNALIADWRDFFGAARLPFLVVQLPNFGALASEPVESGWAALRDAQRRTAVGDDNVGLVVAIDIGDRLDLHPPNKQAVGLRAAKVAEGIVFGDAVETNGHSPIRARLRGRNAIVEFGPSAEKFSVVSAAEPAGFELCEDEPAHCVFAEARLDGRTVRLSAPGIRRPARVRYCWADAPVCNLYDETWTPVGPFEMTFDP